MADLHAHVVAHPDVVFRALDREAILLHLESGMYFGLNEVGARAWALLEEGSIETVCASLAEEFDVPLAQVQADIVDLVDRLLDKGLVQPAGAQGA